MHEFVLHAPCEVAAPHDSDAFYMHVHERLDAIPRGRMCLLLGGFNARAADCFGNHTTVTENQNGETMRELLTVSNTCAQQIFTGDPTLGLKWLDDRDAWTTYLPWRHSLQPPGGQECGRTSLSGSAVLTTIGLLLQLHDSRKKTKTSSLCLSTAVLSMTNNECGMSRVVWTSGATRGVGSWTTV